MYMLTIYSAEFVINLYTYNYIATTRVNQPNLFVPNQCLLGAYPNFDLGRGLTFLNIQTTKKNYILVLITINKYKLIKY